MPSTAPSATPEAVLRTLSTVSFTCVRIPFGDRDWTDLRDVFAAFVTFLMAFLTAFLVSRFAADLEADFLARLADVFFLVVFFVAILDPFYRRS